MLGTGGVVSGDDESVRARPHRQRDERYRRRLPRCAGVARHDQAAQVGDRQDAVARAADEFAVRRETRVDVLAAEHGVVSTQSPLLQTLADSLPLTDIGRSEVAEKLTIFAMRLDDSAHAIAALEAVPAAQFTERDDAVSKAMTRLEDARKASWKALGDAPRLDRTSSL